MSITIATENGERLPENLLFEILSWLPVKDVLQYKTVCKSWYDHISTPQFISKHLKNNHYFDENCLLANSRVSGGGFQVYKLFLDQTPRVLANQVHEISMHGAKIYGPCDGLYYLYSYTSDFCAIWNPAINEVTTLPPITPPPNIHYNGDCYGFGLDPLSEYYKVVIIRDCWSTMTDDNYHNTVFVYSLWNNSWKYCEDLVRVYHLKNNTCYIFVRGCCFWLGSYSDNGDYIRIIISFDMASDSIQEIPIPDYNFEWSAESTLGMHEDSLAFFCADKNDRSLGIWTLNDGTWTKIFNITPILDVCYLVGHWKSNKVLLVCNVTKLFLCDLSTLEIKDLDFEINYRSDEIFAYMESLLSVKNKIKPR